MDLWTVAINWNSVDMAKNPTQTNKTTLWIWRISADLKE